MMGPDRDTLPSFAKSVQFCRDLGIVEDGIIQSWLKVPVKLKFHTTSLSNFNVFHLQYSPEAFLTEGMKTVLVTLAL